MDKPSTAKPPITTNMSKTIHKYLMNANIRDVEFAIFMSLKVIQKYHNPICRAARSRMISSEPPPMALTRTSR